MAWNSRKTELLKDLLFERIAIERRPELVVKYGIKKSSLQVIGSHCDDATRQAILNELIDDKVSMVEIDRAEKQSQDADLGTLSDDLNLNKE